MRGYRGVSRISRKLLAVGCEEGWWRGGGGELKVGGLCSEVFSDNGGVILMLKSLLHKLLEMFNFTNCFSRKRKGWSPTHWPACFNVTNWPTIWPASFNLAHPVRELEKPPRTSTKYACTEVYTFRFKSGKNVIKNILSFEGFNYLSITWIMRPLEVNYSS